MHSITKPGRKRLLHGCIRNNGLISFAEELDQLLHPAKLGYAPQQSDVLHSCTHNCCLQPPEKIKTALKWIGNHDDLTNSECIWNKIWWLHVILTFAYNTLHASSQKAETIQINIHANWNDRNDVLILYKNQVLTLWEIIEIKICLESILRSDLNFYKY